MDLQGQIWSLARIGLHHITPLLAAGAIAAIAVAPTAVAANQPSCVGAGVTTQCQTPGDVEINGSPLAQLAPPSDGWWPGYVPSFSYASPGPSGKARK